MEFADLNLVGGGRCKPEGAGKILCIYFEGMTTRRRDSALDFIVHCITRQVKITYI